MSARLTTARFVSAMLALGLAMPADATPPANAADAMAAQADEPDPRAIQDAVDAENARDPANPCYDRWRCPDPMALGSSAAPLAERIAEPGAKPQVERRKRVQRKLILFRDGYLIRIVTRRVTRMARGFTPPPGSAPWQAQLQRPARLPSVTARALEWDDRQACGGSLIAPGWVITAAHCLTDYGADIRSAGYRIRLGVSDIRNGGEGISYRIAAIHAHPDYDPRTLANDIALIRFAADEETARAGRAWVQPIALDPLPAQGRRAAGQQAFFYGWGLTERDAPSAPLQIGVVRLEPERSCANSAIALCARGIGARGVTQCHGDSGGPLVLFEQRVPLLIGIVSHNIGRTRCGENPRPGVFTRVASFRGWIEGLTGPLPRPPAPAAAARR